MIRLVAMVLCQVYKTEAKMIGPAIMVLTPMVTMEYMMMENGGYIRHKP